MFSFVLNSLIGVALAAPAPFSVQPQKLDTYVRSGVIVGGVAGQSFSILRMQKLAGSETSERLVIVYGDMKGEPVKTDPGYFHIDVDEKLSRVSIDLAQVTRTAIEPKQLAQLFAGSTLVSSTEMTMDPIDYSTNLALTLRRRSEVKAKIENLKGTRALVIELRPVRGNE